MLLDEDVLPIVNGVAVAPITIAPALSMLPVRSDPIVVLPFILTFVLLPPIVIEPVNVESLPILIGAVVRTVPDDEQPISNPVVESVCPSPIIIPAVLFGTI
jgi:hypothetical protein